MWVETISRELLESIVSGKSSKWLVENDDAKHAAFHIAAENSADSASDYSKNSMAHKMHMAAHHSALAHAASLEGDNAQADHHNNMVKKFKKKVTADTNKFGDGVPDHKFHSETSHHFDELNAAKKM